MSNSSITKYNLARFAFTLKLSNTIQLSEPKFGEETVSELVNEWLNHREIFARVYLITFLVCSLTLLIAVPIISVYFLLKQVEGVDALIYVGDGRFHLESIMISNPLLAAYRYDPYNKSFTREYYDHKVMRKHRKKAVDTARNAVNFGIILGK